MKETAGKTALTQEAAAMGMNRNESKYFNTASRMDEALLKKKKKKDIYKEIGR